MAHTIREKAKPVARVRRMRGQIEAVERALEEEKGCAEVLLYCPRVACRRSPASANVAERRLSMLWPLADFGTMWSFADTTQTGKLAMRIRTPTDLGAIIRDSRLKLGLNQKSLADRIGVGREWMVEVEKGKPRAQIGLVLRTVNALGIALEARPETATPKKRPARPEEAPVDIDSIVAAARKPRK